MLFEYNVGHSTSVLLVLFLSFLGSKSIVEKSAALMLDLQAPLKETDGVTEALRTFLSQVQKKTRTSTFET